MKAVEAVLKDLSKMVSSMSLQTGRNAGTSALHPMETTLRMSKGMLQKNDHSLLNSLRTSVDSIYDY